MREGTRVRALTRIVENDQEPDPNAEPCRPGWVHAEEGDIGEVVHVEPLANLCPGEDDVEGLGVTVGFERTGTATLVLDGEVEPLEDS